MYEPYPVPELAREHQRFRYSSLWTFAKQDLRLLLFFLLIASLIGFGVGYFWSCFYRVRGFLPSSYARFIWSMTGFQSPHDVPPNLNGIWGALLFNVYRAQRQERIVQAEMVGLIDRAIISGGVG